MTEFLTAVLGKLGNLLLSFAGRRFEHDKKIACDVDKIFSEEMLLSVVHDLNYTNSIRRDDVLMLYEISRFLSLESNRFSNPMIRRRVGKLIGAVEKFLDFTGAYYSPFESDTSLKHYEFCAGKPERWDGNESSLAAHEKAISSERYGVGGTLSEEFRKYRRTVVDYLSV